MKSRLILRFNKKIKLLSPRWTLVSHNCKKLGMAVSCMQDTFARARPSARATIGYIVYKIPM